jgi:hypothetical protein
MGNPIPDRSLVEAQVADTNRIIKVIQKDGGRTVSVSVIPNPEGYRRQLREIASK